MSSALNWERIEELARQARLESAGADAGVTIYHTKRIRAELEQLELKCGATHVEVERW